LAIVGQTAGGVAERIIPGSQQRIPARTVVVYAAYRLLMIFFCLRLLTNFSISYCAVDISLMNSAKPANLSRFLLGQHSSTSEESLDELN
jgi:hypothetical protein